MLLDLIRIDASGAARFESRQTDRIINSLMDATGSTRPDVDEEMLRIHQLREYVAGYGVHMVPRAGMWRSALVCTFKPFCEANHASSS